MFLQQAGFARITYLIQKVFEEGKECFAEYVIEKHPLLKMTVRFQFFPIRKLQTANRKAVGIKTECPVFFVANKSKFRLGQFFADIQRCFGFGADRDQTFADDALGSTLAFIGSKL